jgi:hypothetical protein
MPYNIFSGADAAQRGLEDGAQYVNDFMDRSRQQRAGYAAAPRIAAGDYRGAAQAYAGEGMADQARALMGDQTQADQQAYERKRQMTADELKAAEFRVQVLQATGDKLKATPFGQRLPIVSSAARLFAAAGYPAEFMDGLSRLTEEDLTDSGVDAVVKPVVRELQFFQTEQGILAGDKHTGQVSNAYPMAPRPKGQWTEKKNADGSTSRVWLTEPTQDEAPPATGGPPPSAPAPAGNWLGSVAAAAPDARVTSGYRTPQHNAEVGGKPDSRHLSGQAVDLVPRPGETMAQLHARLSRVPGVRAINEGDHVHVQTMGPRPAAGPARASGSQTEIPWDAPQGPEWRDLPGGGQVNIRTGEKKNVPGGPGIRKDFAQLRKEFNQLDEVKNFKDVRSAYLQVRALASKPNPTPADDTALTFSFMKMLDPGSVVREGEFALVGRSAGLPDQIVMQLAKVDQGKGLTPTIRARLVETAAQVLLQRRATYDQQAETYRSIALDMGANPDQLVESPTKWRGRIKGGASRPGTANPAKPGGAKYLGTE